MKILVVSGIWPPDVGGPATHAPEVAGFLHRRGHDVRVLTTASSAPAAEAYDVRWVDRRIPVGVRHLVGSGAVARLAAPAGVVYTTGMFGRSAFGARLARTPYVLKLTSDPAFERALRRGLAPADLEQFQRNPGDLRIRVLRALRDSTLRGAARILCPSSYLRDLIVRWGLDPRTVEVLPNAVPPPPELPDRDELRRRLGLLGPTLVFAGRLTAQKSVDLAVEAVAANEGVSLVLVGEGDERARLERQAAAVAQNGRIRFVGAQPRERVLEYLRGADALLLSSSWENFPHAVVEALSVGTPVLATAAGGVTEIVENGRNGLLTEPGDAGALGAAIRRFFAEDELRDDLRAAAAPSVARFAPEPIYGRLERILEEAAASR